MKYSYSIGNTYKCDHCGHWGELPMEHKFSDTWLCPKCGKVVRVEAKEDDEESKIYNTMNTQLKEEASLGII